MGSELEIDTARFPLLLTVFPEVVAREPLERALSRYQQIVLERGVPYVSVIDATRLEHVLSTEARRTIVAFRKRGVELGIARLQRGIVIVTTSVLLRTATSVVDWAAPLPSSWTTVGTREAAFAWARAQLDRQSAR